MNIGVAAIFLSPSGRQARHRELRGQEAC